MKKLVLLFVTVMVLSACTADEIKNKNDENIESINPKDIKVPTHG